MKTVRVGFATQYQSGEGYEVNELVLYGGYVRRVSTRIPKGSTATGTEFSEVMSLNNAALTGTPTATTATLGDNSTQISTTAFVQSTVGAAISGVVNDRGNYDASGNVYPSSGGTGVAGAIQKGNLWYISIAGVLGGVAVNVGDTIRALVDAPGQTSANWAQIEGNLGYTPENQVNKSTDGTIASPSDTTYLSSLAAKTYADSPKSSVWRPVDSTDTSKKLSLNLSGIGTGTTKSLTMPNADVDLAKVPTSLGYSAGVLTLGTADSVNMSVGIPVVRPSVIVTGSSPTVAVLVNTEYQLTASNSGAMVFNLPLAPADHDVVVIRDHIFVSAYMSLSSLTINSGATNTIGLGGATHSLDLLGSAYYRGYLVSRAIIRLTFQSSDSNWYIDISSTTTLSSSLALQSGPNGPTRTLTLNGVAGTWRNITFPDRDITLDHLKYIPAVNTNSSNTVGGTNAAIVAGGSNMTTKTNQVILTGTGVNADFKLVEGTVAHGDLSTAVIACKNTAAEVTLKQVTTNNGSGVLTSTTVATYPPTYLTKPGSVHAVGYHTLSLFMVTSTGAVWAGQRIIVSRWDGATATFYTQTVGTDVDPDVQTIVISVADNAGSMQITVQNNTGGLTATVNWHAKLTSTYNGG